MRAMVARMAAVLDTLLAVDGPSPSTPRCSRRRERPAHLTTIKRQRR